MKLMQLNIWRGRLTSQILKLVKAEQPDIICMQEVFSSADVTIKNPDRTFESLKLIVSAGGYGHTFFAPIYSVDYSGHHVLYGNAIVSKYPLEDQQVFFTKGEFIENLDVASEFDAPYNLQTVRLQTNSGPVTVANHHGYWLTDPMGDETSATLMRKVADRLKDIAGPLILAGDLNVVAASPAMRAFDGWLEDLTATHGIKNTLSELGKVPDVPCDHILVTADVKVQTFSASDALVSDHKALLLEFDL